MPVVNVNGTRINFPEGTTPEEMTAAASQLERRQSQDRNRESARQAYAGVNPVAKFAIGVGAAAAEPIMGLKQLGLKALGRDTTGIEEQIASVRGARDAAGGWGTTGEVAGFIGGTAAAAPKVIAKGISKLPRMIQPLSRILAPAAAEQGLYEASRGTLEDDPSRLARGATGAAGGALGAGVGQGVGKVAAGLVGGGRPSMDALRLQREGDRLGIPQRLTPGQQAGRGTFTENLEEGLRTLPVARQLIDARRANAVDDWNRLQLEKTAQGIQPINQSVGESGAKGIEYVQNLVNRAYRDAVDGVRIDVPANVNPFRRTQDAIDRLPPADAATAQKYLDNLLTDVRSGKLEGDAIIETRSNLDKIASQHFRKGEYTLGEVLDQMDDDFKAVWAHFTPARKQELLDAANTSYARLKPIQRAAGYKGALEAGSRFTPSQLVGGVTRGMPDSVKARQGSPMLREALAANRVMGSSIPNPGPGTAERLALYGTLAGGAGLAGDILTGDDPVTLASPLAGAATGVGLAASMVAPGARRRAAGKFIRKATDKATPGAARGGALTLSEMLRDEE